MIDYAFIGARLKEARIRKKTDAGAAGCDD